MTKKTKSAPSATCTDVIYGSKCALSGEHQIHSTKPPGKKGIQFTTWTPIKDGKIEVTSFGTSGKQMGSWTEDAHARITVVGPQPAPAGELTIEYDDKVIAIDIAEGEPTSQIAERMATAINASKPESKPSLADACSKCGRELGEHDGKKCPKPKYDKAATLAPVTCDVEHPTKKYPCTQLAGHVGMHVASGQTWKRAPNETRAPAPKATEPTAQIAKTAKVVPLTKIGDHDVHPAAALFPMIGVGEWPAFADDISKNGQRKSIVRILVDGTWLILDGRNRLRACLEAGAEPRFRVFGDDPGDGDDPIAFVVSENVQRRHLNETQRAFVGAELVPMYEAQAKERMLAGIGDPGLNKSQGRSAELAARAVNVSRSSVESALKVNRDGAPEVIAAAKDRGQIKVSTAAKLTDLPKVKQQEIVAKVGGGELRSGKVRSLINQENKRTIIRDINEGRVPDMPRGPFGVIYGDYPWLFENSDQHEGSRGHMSYPPMALHQAQLESARHKRIAVSDVTILDHARLTRSRAASSCILALWTTNWHIIKQMPQVLDAYGSEHRTVITWPKKKAGVGSWPRGQTEHLVIASIGEPVHSLNEITTLLESYASREHSRKPDEVAELLQKHCSGPFLELFGRDPRSGWIVWGAEANKFATEAA